MLRNAILKNWRTTIGGVVAGVVLVLNQVQNVLDDDVATQLDWDVIAAAIGIIYAAVMARDAGMPAEQTTSKETS